MGALRSEGHDAVIRAELHSLPPALLANGRNGWASPERERRDHHGPAIARLRRMQQGHRQHKAATQDAVRTGL